MLLETIRNLAEAGGDALQKTCGLTVLETHVSVVRQGLITFPGLGEISIRNGTLQKVHLGCDTALVGQLAGRADPGRARGGSGLEALVRSFLDGLLEGMDARNPRGSVEKMAVEPRNLATRGLRTFGFRFETEAGQMFLLAEVPSRGEMEAARSSDFLTGMQSSYFPSDWQQRDSLDVKPMVDGVMVYLRKAEHDLFLDVSGEQDESLMHAGVIVDSGTVDGERAMKLCTDLVDADLAAPGRGDTVHVTVGVDDRSLVFSVPYLGETTHTAGGVALPCAWFGVPERLSIRQRRRSFRLPLAAPVAVDIISGDQLLEGSPWGDREIETRLLPGRIKDLSFSGACVVLGERDGEAAPQAGDRIYCRLHLPDVDEPLEVAAIVRRSTIGLADRNLWRDELGLEFVVAREEDRDALALIRDFVLTTQRSRLAHRIQVVDARQW